MNRNINLKNIKVALSSKTSTVRNKGISIEAIFDLEECDITNKTDDQNFEGIANYTLDTEYGGGPVSVNLEFFVKNGKLIIDFNQVDYEQVLDWKEIAKESNITHAYIDDDEDDEEENFDNNDIEDYDYFDEAEDED